MTDFESGSFFALKSQNLVIEEDIQNYDQMTQNLMNTQGIAILFGAFWGRMLESSNFFPKLKTKNQKIVYYFWAAFIPSVINLFFSVPKYTSDLEKLDRKYTPLFLEKKALYKLK